MAIVLKIRPWGLLKLLFDYAFFARSFNIIFLSFLSLQCGLEKSIESAIAKGDFATAEELSDRLATREVTF